MTNSIEHCSLTAGRHYRAPIAALAAGALLLSGVYALQAQDAPVFTRNLLYTFTGLAGSVSAGTAIERRVVAMTLIIHDQNTEWIPGVCGARKTVQSSQLASRIQLKNSSVVGGAIALGRAVKVARRVRK